MTENIIGEVGVKIRPDFSGFTEETRRRVRESTSRTKAQVPVGPDLSRFSTEVRAYLAKFNPSEQVHIGAALDRLSFAKAIAEAKRIADQADAKVDIRTNLRQVARDFDGFSGSARNLLGILKFPAAVSGLGLLASAASAAGAAALGLIGALSQVGGLVATLPGLLAAAGQGAGVAALATSGLKDALKEMGAAHTSAGSSAASSGKAQQAAADAIKSAERGVRDALEGVTDAQRSLNDARRDALQRMKDLRSEEVRLALDKRGAVLGIKEAEADLRKTLADPAATNLEKQRAKLRTEEARQSRTEITRRIALNKREIKAGVEGSSQVIAAKEGQKDAAERLADAQDQLAKANRNAAQAAVASVGGIDKLAQAMANLSPAGQRFAKFLFGLKPRFTELRNIAQAGLFPGLEAAISRLVNAHFPLLRRTVDATADTLGDLAVEGARMVSSGPWRADFAASASLNVRLLRIFGRAGLNLADAFRNIVGAARPLTLAVAKLALKWSGVIRGQAQAGRESGALRGFFEKTLATTKRLLSILGNLGRILGSALGAAVPLGDDLLATLDRLTEKWADFLDSTTGRKGLEDAFKRARPAIDAVGRLVGDIAKAFGDLATNTNLAPTIEQFRTQLLPVLVTLTDTVSEAFTPALIGAVTNLAKVFTDLAGDSGGLNTFVSTVGLLAGALDKLLHIPGMRPLVVNLLVLASVGKALKFTAAISGIKLLVTSAKGASGAISGLVGGFGRLAGGFRSAQVAESAFSGRLGTAGGKLRTLTSAIGSGARAFGRYVVQAGLAIGRTVAMGAVAVAQGARIAAVTAAQLAAAAASRVWAAVQAVLNFVLSANPIGLVVIAIGLLIGGIVLAYKKSATFRKIVDGAFRAVAAAGKFMWETVLKPVFRFLLQTWLTVAGGILDGAALAFGWVPVIGGPLRKAAKKFHEFAGKVNDSLDGVKNKDVIVTAKGVFKAPKGIIQLPGGGGDFSTKANNRARGGPIFGPGTGTSDDVPIWASAGEHVWTAAEVARAGGHGVMEQWRRSIRGYATGGAVEDARPGRFRVTQRTSGTALEEGLARFNRTTDRFALALGKSLGSQLNFGGGASGAISGAKFGGGAMAYIAKFLRDAGVAFQVISGLRPGAVTRGSGRQSLHALGRALDLVGAGKSSMLDIWRAATRIPFKKEVIFSPAPFQVYGSGKHPGPPSNPITRADHYNHVHVGLFDQGGWLPKGVSVAVNRTGRPERVQGPRETAGVTQNFTLVQQPGQSAPAFVQQAMFAARTQLRPAG